MATQQAVAKTLQTVVKKASRQNNRTTTKRKEAQAPVVPAAKLVDPKAWLRHAIETYKPCKAHAKRATRRATARLRREKHLERKLRFQLRPQVKRPLPMATSESGHMALLLNAMGERVERTLSGKQATRRQAHDRTRDQHEAGTYKRSGGGAIAGTGRSAGKKHK